MSNEENKVFEDEFMEVQSDLLALTLETTGKIVDKIFVYCSIEKKSLMFNTFVELNGKIMSLSNLEVERNKIWSLLKSGTNDLERIKEVCSKYDKPTPTEIKMVYDVKSGKLDAKYQYMEICSAKTNISSGEVFIGWMNEMKQE